MKGRRVLVRLLLWFLLVAVVLALVVSLSVYAYRKYKNYQRTKDYFMQTYVEGVMQLEVLWCYDLESPIDLQRMVDDLGLIPPPNPYRRDRKTVITPPDRFVPRAVIYIAGPAELPYTRAAGLFLASKNEGGDYLTAGDDPWILGWRFSKPDGLPDGIRWGVAYDVNCFGDRPPLRSPSKWWKWRSEDIVWKCSDGTRFSPVDERAWELFARYYNEHPENFDMSKRPRKPEGITIPEDMPNYDHVKWFYEEREQAEQGGSHTDEQQDR